MYIAKGASTAAMSVGKGVVNLGLISPLKLQSNTLGYLNRLDE